VHSTINVIADVNETFQGIMDILQNIFINEHAVQRVFNTAVNRSTTLVRFYIHALFGDNGA